MNRVAVCSICLSQLYVLKGENSNYALLLKRAQFFQVVIIKICRSRLYLSKAPLCVIQQKGLSYQTCGGATFPRDELVTASLPSSRATIVRLMETSVLCYVM